MKCCWMSRVSYAWFQSAWLNHAFGKQELGNTSLTFLTLRKVTNLSNMVRGAKWAFQCLNLLEFILEQHKQCNKLATKMYVYLCGNLWKQSETDSGYYISMEAMVTCTPWKSFGRTGSDLRVRMHKNVVSKGLLTWKIMIMIG